MAKTEGFIYTFRPKYALATSNYLKKLTELTAQMGGDIMVLEVPNNVSEHGTVYEDAFARAVEIIREVQLAGKLVSLAVEPLSPVETSFYHPVRKHAVYYCSQHAFLSIASDMKAMVMNCWNYCHNL